MYYNLRDEKSMEIMGYNKLKKKNVEFKSAKKNWNTTPRTEDLAQL